MMMLLIVFQNKVATLTYPAGSMAIIPIKLTRRSQDRPACTISQTAVIILTTLKYVTVVDITFMHYRPLLTTVMHDTAASTVRDFTTPPC